MLEKNPKNKDFTLSKACALFQNIVSIIGFGIAIDKNNPQNKDFALSKACALFQNIVSIIGFGIAIAKEIKIFTDANSILVISGVVLVIEYILSYYKSIFFDKGHRIREVGLIDNSFNEKKIPNYNSECYYNNVNVSKGVIKLLANIHENSLFTSRIAEKMAFKYYVILAVVVIFFIIKVFINGLDDFSALLLSFIVSSGVIDNVINLFSLKKSSEDVYEKINEICNRYENNSIETSMILSQIIEVLLLYENAVFESKINLSERIFSKLNSSLSKEWIDIRNNYLIYGNQK